MLVKMVIYLKTLESIVSPDGDQLEGRNMKFMAGIPYMRSLHNVQSGSRRLSVCLLVISNKQLNGYTFLEFLDGTQQLDQFKQMLTACQKADGSYFLGQERSADGGIRAAWDHSNIRSVM
jgi:hypothetical protein